MNENIQLFKDTNPEAYSELKEAYVYNTELKLEELAADTEALGLFICQERQHQYIMPINQRSNPEYDLGCPVCKAELLNISLFKAKQRIYRQTRYDLFENLWICKKCRKAWWSSRNSDDYVIASHKEKGSFGSWFSGIGCYYCTYYECCNEIILLRTRNFQSCGEIEREIESN